ncbi:MAG: hypothetical protein AB7I50_17615 [Vicinamibacterales bacterium]
MRLWIVVCTCVFVGVLMPPIRAERPPAVAGQWDVTIHAPGQTIAERWTIQQKDAKITGMAKGIRGDRPLSGTMAGARFVVTVKDGDTVDTVVAMLDGEVMEGTVTSGAGTRNPWHAKRSKPATR